MLRTIRGRKGFTLVELLITITIITLFVTILVPAVTKARESANRTACASHLRQIGQAMAMYARENRELFPRTVAGPGPLDAFTNPASLDPFIGWASTETPGAADGSTRPADNDITAALFLLVRTKLVASDVFVCPSSGVSVEADPTGGQIPEHRSNFSSPQHLGYSVSVPYADPAGASTGYRWKNNGKADFALMADLNPGVSGTDDAAWDLDGGPTHAGDSAAALRRGNSNNHRKHGQNVLYADGHVTFHNTPFCGDRGDNIYTVAGDTPGYPSPTGTSSSSTFRSPTWARDSVMLPTDDVIVGSGLTPEERTGTAGW